MIFRIGKIISYRNDRQKLHILSKKLISLLVPSKIERTLHLGPFCVWTIFDSFGFLVEIIKWISKYKFLHISKRVHVVLLRLKFIHCLYSELLQLLACTLVLGSTYICIWSLVFSFQRRPKLQYLYGCYTNLLREVFAPVERSIICMNII